MASLDRVFRGGEKGHCEDCSISAYGTIRPAGGEEAGAYVVDHGLGTEEETIKDQQIAEAEEWFIEKGLPELAELAEIIVDSFGDSADNFQDYLEKILCDENKVLIPEKIEKLKELCEMIQT